MSASTTPARSNQHRQLTFEDRIRAQEAIERVYYSHQIGATKPFAEVVPREALEKKVRTYLKQSLALERYWNTPVTAEALHSELTRIMKQTQSPNRLMEIESALGHDPLLLLECLARPLLADRLARRFFSRDARIHTDARHESESLRERLVAGQLGVFDEHPSRHVADVARKDALPSSLDEVGEIREGTESFSVSVLLEEDAERLRFARYVVSKLSWDDWWRQVESELDDSSVRAVAPVDLQLPQSLICGTDDSWSPSSIQDPVPDGRNGHTAVWTGSEMIIWGGQVGYNTRLNTGLRYDPVTDAWAPISSIDAPSVRILHTAVWTGTRMIVWGGEWNASLNTGGIYDPVSDTWQPTSTLGAYIGAEGHTAVWTGSEMIVWGGETFDGMRQYMQNGGGRYNPQTDTWKPTSTLGAPEPRYNHTAVWTGSRMIIYGGFDLQVFRSGGSYDPVHDRWEATPLTGAPSLRTRHSALWTGREMVIWGGERPDPEVTEFLNTGAKYDPLLNRWTSTSTSGAPSGRASHSAIWTGKEMIIWGSSPDSTGGRYDPLLNRWKPVALANAPMPRGGHSAIWTGSLMIVWGGSAPVSIDAGARYDPASNSWTPMVESEIPSARSSHTAVWTGNQVIVWGGESQGALLDSGGRYDPMTDSWSTTSRKGAPIARRGHSAVWTGRYMLIWGGDPGGINQTLWVPSGGRYDPISDTWLPVSTAGSTGFRRFHRAVWTGSEMIVWGGLSDQFLLNTGARYDPDGNTWLPTSIIGAPSERESFTAVWTGTEMIVWGGFGYSAWVNTGGRYDPARDLWTATSTAAAPDARRHHTAVWTGSEMFVWGGGVFGSTVLQTGGLYNPLTDTWRPTTLAGAPTARSGHTPVWTGHVAIVWGGSGNTGGRYDPALDAWSDTSTTGAPSERSGHTAVWTGSSMFVWGGSGDKSGGSYLLEQTVDNDGDGMSECDGDCNDDNPSTLPGIAESCDGVDNDCDTEVDEDGACDPVVTSPLSGQVVDCSLGATPPTITWEPGRFDGFRVYIAWDPAFPTTARVTSGDSLVRTSNSWTPSSKKWRKACTNANPDLYLRVEGFDSSLPKGDPLKRLLSDVVAVTTQ